MTRLTFYPFSYAVHDDLLASSCWYCLKEMAGRRDTVPRCASCKTAVFCGQQCQRLGWMDHQAECRGLRDRTPWIPSCDVRMLGRTVLRYRQLLDGEQSKSAEFLLNRTSQRSLMEIGHHERQISGDPKAMSEFQRISADLRRFYRKKYLVPADDIFKIYARIHKNAQQVRNGFFRDVVAKALYLDMSDYKHSCRPNAVRIFDGFVVTLRSLMDGVDVADKESTYIDHVDLMLPKDARKEALKDRQYLDCNCVRCLDTSDHLLTALRCPKCAKSVLIYDANDQLKVDPLLCVHCKQQFSGVGSALEGMKRIDLELGRLDFDNVEAASTLVFGLIGEFETKLAEENVFLARLYETTSKCGNGSRSRMIAIRNYWMKCLPCLRICFPDNHYMLAHHYVVMTAHSMSCNDLESAQTCLQQALRRFAVCVGVDHPTYTMWEGYLRICSTDQYCP